MVSVAISRGVDHFDEAGYCGPFKSQICLLIGVAKQHTYPVIACYSPLFITFPPGNKTPEIHGIRWFRLPCAVMCLVELMTV